MRLIKSTQAPTWAEKLFKGDQKKIDDTRKTSKPEPTIMERKRSSTTIPTGAFAANSMAFSLKQHPSIPGLFLETKGAAGPKKLTSLKKKKCDYNLDTRVVPAMAPGQVIMCFLFIVNDLLYKISKFSQLT